MLEDNIFNDPLPGTSSDQHKETVRQFDPLLPDNVTSSSEDGDAPSNPTASIDRELQLKIFLERFFFDQSRRPKKGDIISYFDSVIEDWIRIQIIGTQKPTSVHKDYFNIKFLDLDREDEGLYLYPGSYWTFGQPILRDQNPEAIATHNPDPEVSRSDCLAPRSPSPLANGSTVRLWARAGSPARP